MLRRPSSLTALVIVAVLAGSLPAGAIPAVPTWADDPSEARAPRARAPIDPGFSISRKDGNDVAGPLDLASMKISRGKTKDTVSFSTLGPVSNAAIDPDNGNFAILIDTNDDRDYDYAQYVFVTGGKLRGSLVRLTPNRLIDATVPTSRTGPRGFRQVIQRAKIHSPGTYRFAVFGFYQAAPCSSRKPCIDTIPNLFPLIPLDHRDPTFGWDSWHPYSGDGSDELTSPIQFHFDDDQYGTGVKEWLVQRKLVGAGTGWKTVKDGRILNPTVFVPGKEGATYDVRVLVVDKQKNRRVSTSKRTTLPFDDDAATYDPLVAQDVALAGWFLGTATGISNALAPGTATFTFEGAAGTEVCLMGGPVQDAGMTATADVTLDGIAQAPVSENDATPLRSRLWCSTTADATPHTLVVTATSATELLIDGFYVVP